MAKRDRPMDEIEIKSTIKHYVTLARSHNSMQGEERQKNLDLYYSELFGNEREGYSAIVSSDVQDTIETVMPDLMEMFAGTQTPIEFQPEHDQEEEQAGYQTDMVNYVIMRDNKGYTVIHDWFKDALLQKLGVVMAWWDDREIVKTYKMRGQDPIQMKILEDDPELEILSREEINIEETGDQIPLWDLEVKRTTKRGRVRIDGVPPENFFILPAVRSSSPEDTPYIGYNCKRTIADLVSEGFDADDLLDLPRDCDDSWDWERVNRYESDGDIPYEADPPNDPVMREVWVYTHFIRMDEDGDGKAEYRCIRTIGGSHHILEDYEINDHPFAVATPIRMPHKVVGRALADLTRDIQMVKSTLQRMCIDNANGLNNNRALINTNVDLDSWLENRPGGAILVDAEDIRTSFQAIQPQPILQHILPFIEYWDGVRETRAGVPRMNQGLDPDALNKTFKGMAMIMGRAQRRILFIARTFAETGFKDLAIKVRNLLVENMDRPRTIKLRNKWIDIDPRSWNADMDAMVSLALGSGTQEQLGAAAMQMLDIQKQLVEYQGGTQGPMVDLKRIHNTLELLCFSQGIKNADAYFMDPEGPEAQKIQPPPPKPDPKMIEAQGKLQIEGMKAQGDMAIKQQAMQGDLAIKKQAMEGDMALNYQGMMMDSMAATGASPGGAANGTGAPQGAPAAGMLPSAPAPVTININKDKEDEDRMQAMTNMITSVLQAQAQSMNEILNTVQMLAQEMSGAVQQMAAPKVTRIERDKSGRATHSVTEPMVQ